jgi:FkbM family methyltransferase
LLETSSFDMAEVGSLKKLLELCRHHRGNGVVAIDGRANIGVHTVEFATTMAEWGQVISFEPQERLFYALAGNIALNNCSNARAIFAALGNEETHISVPQLNYDRPASFGSMELRPNPQNEFIGQNIPYTSPGNTVPLTRIDTLKLPRLNLLKLDVEGMETEALAGATATIEQHRPVLHVEAIKADRKQLQFQLRGFGYDVMDLGMNLLAFHSEDPIRACVKRVEHNT